MPECKNQLMSLLKLLKKKTILKVDIVKILEAPLKYCLIKV